MNDDLPAVGRAAITDVARSFMTAFPDMQVRMDGVSGEGREAVFRWTLIGTNAGPVGNGHAVEISGFEEWRLGDDGLVSGSRGHFDAVDYQRQIEGR